MASSSERYAALVQWVRDGGGSLHPGVEIAQIAGMRGSFRATDAVGAASPPTAANTTTHQMFVARRLMRPS